KLRWSSLSIRARLTAWYAFALTAMMIVYATATFFAVRHEFLEQLDDQLHDDFETAEGLLVHAPDGRVTWPRDAHHDPDADEGRVYEVWSASGEQLLRSGASTSLPPVVLASTAFSSRYDTVEAHDERWRTLTAPVAIAGRAVVMRVSRSEE